MLNALVLIKRFGYLLQNLNLKLWKFYCFHLLCNNNFNITRLCNIKLSTLIKER